MYENDKLDDKQLDDFLNDNNDDTNNIVDDVGTFSEEVETFNDNSNDNNNNDYRKKMKRLFIIVIGVVAVFLIIIVLMSVFVKKNYSYESVEEIMKNAASKYYEDNKKNLPENEVSPSQVDVNTLINGGYMKSLSEYGSKFASCSGTVTVNMMAGKYFYISKLDCGESYTTTSLKQQLVKDSNVVVSGDGLYNMNHSLVFRGERVNNYISIDDTIWRIVKVYSDNSMELILNDKLTREVWDDRYNIESKSVYGNNNYSMSRIKTSLEDLYINGINRSSVKFSISDKAKSLFVSFSSCVGIRGEDETSKDGSIECNTVQDNTFISLLPVFDYMNASIDENCKSTLDRSCQNYNYLKSDFDFWLANGSTYKSSYVFEAGTSIYSTRANSKYFLRPVVHLSKDALYVSGNGSQDNPYIVR